MSLEESWQTILFAFSVLGVLTLLADLLITGPATQWIVRLVNKHRRRS